MHRNQSVSTHRFAMTPRADIPRSSFNIQTTHKLTFNAGYLVPIYVDEVLPGDTFNMRATLFARLATPLFPIMDNLHLNTFFFFVPNRLVWDNWAKLMGERKAPNDSIDFLVPKIQTPDGGYPPGELEDFLGLPTTGQMEPTYSVKHSVLWQRAYNLIWNEWFRDENLQQPAPFRTDDAGDVWADFKLRKRGKRHDYFTSCLPWPQKGESVTLPLGTSAPVIPDTTNGTSAPLFMTGTGLTNIGSGNGTNNVQFTAGNQTSGSTAFWSDPHLIADLSQATAATINQIRTSFQIQKLLERDARGGTRYTEIIKSHFGVHSPDARLQRPEYLGGGQTPIQISPIAQTSGSPGIGGYTDTPQGNLAAMGTALAQGHGFTSSFVEHGMIIGLACVTADLTYQQGIRKMFTRETRYDFYFPAFAMLGEQAVLNKELYVKGSPNADGTGDDNKVFGYQERWAEYRYHPSQMSGLFKSTTANTIDAWHLAQHFTALPTLSDGFIQESPPLERTLAIGAGANGQQLIMDCFFQNRAARPLPLYSVPGLMDHF